MNNLSVTFHPTIAIQKFKYKTLLNNTRIDSIISNAVMKSYLYQISRKWKYETIDTYAILELFGQKDNVLF